MGVPASKGIKGLVSSSMRVLFSFGTHSSWDAITPGWHQSTQTHIDSYVNRDQ